jgi:hypothetical protein
MILAPFLSNSFSLKSAPYKYSVFVLLAGSSPTQYKVVHSNDGTNWIQSNVISFVSGYTDYKLNWIGGRYIITFFDSTPNYLFFKYYSSTDGINWTLDTFNGVAGTNYEWIGTSNSFYLNGFSVLCGRKKLRVFPATTVTDFVRSFDGVSYKTVQPSMEQFNSNAFISNNKAYLINRLRNPGTGVTEGTLYSTTDLKTYNLLSNLFLNDATNFAGINSGIYFIGANQSSYLSTNNIYKLVNDTLVKTNSSQLKLSDIDAIGRKVISNPTVMLIVDEVSRKALRSVDGINWFQLDLPPYIHRNCIGWDGSRFIAFYQQGIYTSIDGITWTLLTSNWQSPPSLPNWVGTSLYIRP